MTAASAQPSSGKQQPAARGRRLALWLTQAAAAGIFLFTGGSKLAGAPAMLATFDAIGTGRWFAYVVGASETVSALALMVPPLAPFAALVLAATMIGAVATHLFVIGGSPALPLALLIALLAIAWARRDRLLRACAARQR